MPLSSDPRKRKRSLGNLRRGLSADSVKARSRQLANLRQSPPPPAPEGNQRHRTHGGYARVAIERLDVKVREVFDALAEDVPLKDRGALPAADTVAVRMLAETLCRLEDVSAHIRSFGLIDAESGAVKTVVDVEARLRREVADWLDSLGMTPRARAKLGLDVVRAASAFDLASHWAQGGEHGA